MARMRDIGRIAAAGLAALLIAACSNPVLDAVKRITEAWNPSSDAPWVRSYGGSATEGAARLIATADGGFVAAARTASYGSGEQAVWIVKYGSDAEIEWQFAYGSPDAQCIDYCNDICPVADGGFAFAATIEASGSFWTWIVKLDERNGHRMAGVHTGRDFELPDLDPPNGRRRRGTRRRLKSLLVG